MIFRTMLVIWFSVVATVAMSQEFRPAPEAASGATEKSLVIAKRHMVVAAEPVAGEAGREMLRQGGSAVDAAIATEFVLGLVEPQSSGLGGGVFITLWDAKSHSMTTFDGRETAARGGKARSVSQRRQAYEVRGRRAFGLERRRARAGAHALSGA